MVNASLYLVLLRLFKSKDYKSFSAQSTVLLLITFHYNNLRKATRVISIITTTSTKYYLHFLFLS